MLGRHIRLAGVRLIETTLSTKLAIFNPTMPGQAAWETRRRLASMTPSVPTASASVAKVVGTPSTT